MMSALPCSLVARLWRICQHLTASPRVAAARAAPNVSISANSGIAAGPSWCLRFRVGTGYSYNSPIANRHNKSLARWPALAPLRLRLCTSRMAKAALPFMQDTQLSKHKAGCAQTFARPTKSRPPLCCQKLLEAASAILPPRKLGLQLIGSS